MTSPPSTDSERMLWSGDSRARTSASPGRAPGLPAEGQGCGGRCIASSPKRGRGGASSKTCQPFGLEDWTRCCGRSIRSGSMRNGIVYPQPPLALATGAIEFGLWPTPRACDGRGGADFAAFRRGKSPTLPAVARLFPTPTATANAGCPSMQKWAAHRRLFPTPSATDWKGASKPGQRRGQLGDPAMQVVPAGGQLNPTWVEWLMGFPLGHTDCGRWATPSSRRSRESSRRH